MARLTLAERLDRVARKKAKVEQEAARLKLAQRKARTRDLIALGGLVAKAGLADLSTTALYAAFKRLAAEAQDPAKVTLWEREGGRLFEAEDSACVLAVARFPDKLPPDITAALRALGFRRNKMLNQWEGRVDYLAAESLVKEAGGTIEQIGEPGPNRPTDAGLQHPQSPKLLP